jgi:hypothetical protein
MKRTVALLVGTLTLSAPPALALTPQLTQADMQQAAESFYSVGLDSAKVYRITQAHLERDRMRIDLEGGTLVLSQPILGRVTGACYSGRAKLSLTPPGPREKKALRNHIDSDTFQATVDALYLRFNDSTADDLTGPLTPEPSTANISSCAKLFESRNWTVSKYEEQTIGHPFNLEIDLLESLLSPELSRDFFLLEADVPNQRWVTYVQRPGRSPAVNLLRLNPVGTLFDPETWTAFELGDPAHTAPGAEESFDILHNQMEIVIPNIHSFSIDALVEGKGPVDIGSARLAIINSFDGSTWDDTGARPITIDSVTSEDGTPLPYVHRRHEMLVVLPEKVSPSQTTKVRIKATEETIIQITPESFWILNTYPWFPQEPDYAGGEYTFDWTVKVKRPMIAAGSGTTVREWVEKKPRMNCAQWKTDEPMAFPSLIFGKFKKVESEYKRKSDGKTITIRVFWLPATTLTYRYTDGSLETEPVTVPASKPKNIAEEAGIILGFFEDVLGPYPHDEIDLAQMAPGLGFAQAPPGLVQLTGEYFLSQAEVASFWARTSRTMEFLRTVLAHEIAHHWWGDVVRWLSDEEQWLSESLAEYSSGLYLQASEDDKAFRQMIRGWRKQCERWESDLPIAHANRASGENGGIIRYALLYNKGPLVVHMLRSQLGNDKFKEVLQKLLSEHRGDWIDTNDFQEAVESVAGYKMEWFFDQWVRETGIPELHFSYDVRPHEGKYLLSGRLKQSGASKPKAFFLPVTFHFANGHGAKEWRVSKQNETLQVLLPQQPTKVMIDEFGDLLAKIVYD